MLTNHFDTIVLGAGLSGLTAAAAVAREGRRTALVSAGSGSLVLSGAWLQVDEQTKRAAGEHLKPAIQLFREFAAGAGCCFEGSSEDPRFVPTLLGQLQAVSFAPYFLSHSDSQDERSCAVIGIEGLTCFDPEFMADRLNQSVKELGLRRFYSGRWIRLDGNAGIPLTTIAIARRFDCDKRFRDLLAERLRAVASGMGSILIPGILGLETVECEIDDFQRAAGLQVCEMLTLPPSVPGLRLSRLLERQLGKMGVELLSGFPAKRLDIREGLCTAVEVDAPARPLLLKSETVVIAAGHRSPVLLGDSSGAIDEVQRPVNASGTPIAANLFWAQPSQRAGSLSESNVLKILAGYRAGQCATQQEGQNAAR